MFGVGHLPQIMLLLVVALLVFGPGKVPELGSALGRGIREFRDATNGMVTPPTQMPMISSTAPSVQTQTTSVAAVLPEAPALAQALPLTQGEKQSLPVPAGQSL